MISTAMSNRDSLPSPVTEPNIPQKSILIVDSYSSWIQCIKMKRNTTDTAAEKQAALKLLVLCKIMSVFTSLSLSLTTSSAPYTEVTVTIMSVFTSLSLTTSSAPYTEVTVTIMSVFTSLSLTTSSAPYTEVTVTIMSVFTSLSLTTSSAPYTEVTVTIMSVFTSLSLTTSSAPYTEVTVTHWHTYTCTLRKHIWHSKHAHFWHTHTHTHTHTHSAVQVKQSLKLFKVKTIHESLS